MYHYDARIALEELLEDATLPNPANLRDMMLRSQLAPDKAMELSRKFQAYQHAFGDAQSTAKVILEELAQATPKS